MIKKIVWCIVCSLFTVAAFAQTPKEFQQKYESGKQLLAQGKYDLARQVFQPLTQENSANPYSPYAYYYQAYAAFKSNKPDIAKQNLQQLLAKYPDWNQADNAHYLLANIAFEKGEWASAFAQLDKVKRKEVKQDGDEMKEHYLMQVSDINTLKELQRKFPNDKMLASMMVDRLMASGKPEDVQLAQQLDNQFKLNRVKDIAERAKRSKKNSYNVAVLFPFQVESLNSDRSRNNQFALDMYNGIKLAEEALAGQGIDINVFAYDVGNDADKMMSLINSPEFAGMDLLIGPLYAASNKVAVAYANQRNIALVNPISNNLQLIQNNPAAYLLQPSVQTQAQQTANYALKTFDPKTAQIFYGNAPKDSLMAYAYRDQVMQSGGRVLTFQKVTQTNVAEMATAINEVDLTKVGHLFVATDNQNVALNLISALEKKLSKVPVFTLANWLDFRMLTYQQYEQRNVHFIHPEYIEYGSDSVKTFKEEYKNLRNIIPSFYAYQGYDMMMFFGKMLNQHGTFLHTALHQQPAAPGAILPGYHYNNANDNQYVPIIRFENARLVVVNPITTQ